MKHRILAVAALLLLSLTTTAHADPPSPPMGLAYNGNKAQCAAKAGEGLFHQVFVTSCTMTGTNPAEYWMVYMLHEPDIYEIRNDRGDRTGRCMEVQDKSQSNGATIRAELCDPRKFNQMWRMNIHEPTPRSFVAVHSGKCLAHNPSSIAAIQSTCTTSTRWTPIGLKL